MPETTLAIDHWLTSTSIALWLGALALAWVGFRLILRRRRSRSRRPSRQTSKRNLHHARNVDAARRVFQTLNGWSGDRLLPRMLGYLRKIDPFVFEELVLTALEAQGIKVMRNPRYTGDGGIDGRFMLQGKPYLIQAKRYQRAINADHVRAFAEEITRQDAAGGLFVHTGSTPPGAYRHLAACSKVTLLSGQQLVDLMQARPLRLFRATPSSSCSRRSAGPTASEREPREHRGHGPLAEDHGIDNGS